MQINIFQGMNLSFVILLENIKEVVSDGGNFFIFNFKCFPDIFKCYGEFLIVIHIYINSRAL
ncbi:hypothetical protein GMMP15_1830003 [Candidatus Magnetomoraceae bacterium gMMP-15]